LKWYKMFIYKENKWENSSWKIWREVHIFWNFLVICLEKQRRPIGPPPNERGLTAWGLAKQYGTPSETSNTKRAMAYNQPGQATWRARPNVYVWWLVGFPLPPTTTIAVASGGGGEFHLNLLLSPKLSQHLAVPSFQCISSWILQSSWKHDNVYFFIFLFLLSMALQYLDN
jgi:hypothetical protein